MPKTHQRRNKAEDLDSLIEPKTPGAAPPITLREFKRLKAIMEDESVDMLARAQAGGSLLPYYYEVMPEKTVPWPKHIPLPG